MHQRMTFAPFWLTIAAQCLAAIAFYAAMHWRGARRWTAYGFATAIVSAAPLMLGSDEPPILRSIACLIAVILSIKLYDLSFGLNPDQRPSFRSYVIYLLNVGWLVR